MLLLHGQACALTKTFEAVSPRLGRFLQSWIPATGGDLEQERGMESSLRYGLARIPQGCVPETRLRLKIEPPNIDFGIFELPEAEDPGQFDVFHVRE